MPQSIEAVGRAPDPEATNYSLSRKEDEISARIVDKVLRLGNRKFTIVGVRLSDDVFYHNGRGKFYKGPAILLREHVAGSDCYVSLSDAELTYNGITAHLENEGLVFSRE